MKLKPQYILAATAMVLSTAGVTQATTAVRRFPASECLFETDYSGDYVVTYSTISNASGGTGARARNVHCPLFDANNITDLAVDGFDANNDPTYGVPTAKICQTLNVGTTVTCTATTALLGGTATGAFSTWLPHTLSDGLRDPSRINWYGELVISLPQMGYYGSSSLFGFYAI